MLKLTVASLLTLLFISGCSHKIAVTTLESAIEQSAVAVKSASKGAADKVDIEVSVVTAAKGSATIPVPYVPIGVESSASTTTKLKVTVDLTKYPDPDPDAGVLKGAYPEPQVYILDLNTGEVTPAP